MEQWTGSKLGKEYVKAVYCHSAYLTYMQSQFSSFQLLSCVRPFVTPWIAACASSSPAFLMMYSAYKLDEQGDSIQPWDTPFPIWSQSVVPFPVLIITSCPGYRFLRRQVRWAIIPISWRIFQFVVIHTVKGFGFKFWLCFFSLSEDTHKM